MTTKITGDAVQTANVKDEAGAYNRQLAVQVVNVTDGEVATGTTVMPQDDTIPQNTEGNEVMTLSITPKSNNNLLKIQVTVLQAHSTANSNQVALFKDSDLDAIAVVGEYQGSATNQTTTLTFTHYMIAGTTNAITFKVRAGSNNAGTMTFNGSSSARLYGGVAASSITITEYQPS